MQNKIKLPGYIQTVMQRLEQNGFQVYVVGGAVRDFLMGREPTDYDLTTNALPEQMLKIFSDFRLMTDGLKHGTVTVISAHQPVEVTTFRIDGDYTDNRHPDEVCFTGTVEEDLARRDFTMNAVCYHPDTGFVDPFGGREDIGAGLIRTVGEPAKRLTEDALRIMRAVRFAATLGFQMERKTEIALFQYAAHLRVVSRERVLAEFKKLLLGKYAGKVAMQYLYILLCADSKMATVLQNGRDPVCFSELERVEPVLCVRLAAFFICLARAAGETAQMPAAHLAQLHAENKIETVDFYLCQVAAAVMHSLRLDHKTVKEVLWLLWLFFLPMPETPGDIRRLCGLVSIKRIKAACSLKAAFAKAHEVQQIACFQKECEKACEQCCRLSQLAVGGNEMLKAGLRGAQVGAALQFLLREVQQQHCENEKNALLSFLQKHLAQF